ncbi:MULTISPECIES: DUF2474 family protein [Vibrio]|uniref:DUF2474 family protein n=1 Tax=Vibrio coralliilyticus TaxID=190893 RepID=A0AAP6ZI91_9VIBR|nr:MULTISPECIES: DUF2474 family protein [unclassified Vibrio]ARC94351.1 hypothetical protein B6A42_22630 [Vibrio coralliilyticus]MCM5508211.1 DUF2474 family protein [Vibrio sp. SCSIO 43169]MDE3897761.1 DUF2474 family protein [Vibrio sp. CC007]NOH38826.1 DUF2474 family protein [Vibrio coralliilyticus]NOJ21769.1 DUF2474 family protein [Vibrio coralliilyticus]
MKQFGWFFLIWLASVFSLAVISMSIRWILF